MAGPLNLRERRDKLKREVEQLGAVLYELFKFEKNSQLRVIKLALMCLRKEARFRSLSSSPIMMPPLAKLLDGFFTTNYLDQFLNGFIVCFEARKSPSSNRKRATVASGELIYISENVQNYFEWNSIDIMLTYDSVFEMTSGADAEFFERVCSRPHEYTHANKATAYTNWFVSRIKRNRKNTPDSDYRQFKTTVHYDARIDAFVALCQPVLSASTRSSVTETDPGCFTTTHRLDLRLVSAQGALADLIVVDSMTRPTMSLYEMLAPESLEIVSKRHQEIMDKRSSRGSTDLVKLLLKDGSSMNCLLNMFLDANQAITCVFQMMSDNEVRLYKERMSKTVGEASASSSSSVDFMEQPWSIEESEELETDDGLMSSSYFDTPTGSVRGPRSVLAADRKRPWTHTDVVEYDYDEQASYSSSPKYTRFVDGTNDDYLSELNAIVLSPQHQAASTPASSIQQQQQQQQQQLIYGQQDLVEIESIKSMLETECRHLLSMSKATQMNTEKQQQEGILLTNSLQIFNDDDAQLGLEDVDFTQFSFTTDNFTLNCRQLNTPICY